MVFNGKYNVELYSEYGRWLPFITDVFLPICDSEHGDFISLPFDGSVMEQPYQTMQILRLIQLNYRICLKKKQQESLSSSKSKMRYR